MRTTAAPIARVCTAIRPRRIDAAGEDRIFRTPNAVIVLDGASEPDPTEHDGGWLADTLGREIQTRLSADTTTPLADLLAASIATNAARYALQPGSSPSTTVAIVRWSVTTIDVLVLGDSPVIAYDRAGQAHEIRDDRLALVTYRRAGRQRTSGFATDQLDRWRTGHARQRQLRNRPEGYWIAEADPEAAYNAVCASWPVEQLVAVLAMTDGVSAGVDEYRTPAHWSAALDMAAVAPSHLIDAVHQAEESDPDGVRWPRSKRHDDKALALVRFDVQ